MYLMAGSELASKFNLSDLHKDVCKHTVLLIMSKNMLTMVCMAEVGSFLAVRQHAHSHALHTAHQSACGGRKGVQGAKVSNKGKEQYKVRMYPCQQFCLLCICVCVL
jgi:hypothetical protein